MCDIGYIYTVLAAATSSIGHIPTRVPHTHHRTTTTADNLKSIDRMKIVKNCMHERDSTNSLEVGSSFAFTYTLTMTADWFASCLIVPGLLTYKTSNKTSLVQEGAFISPTTMEQIFAYLPSPPFPSFLYPYLLPLSLNNPVRGSGRAL